MHIKDKKVIFLYRVSTDKQLDDEDIPMQQRASDQQEYTCLRGIQAAINIA